MKLMPEYAQTLIVGVLFQKTWSWYITEREYWFLNTEMEDRFGITVLDETTAETFLDKIIDLKVSTSDLRKLLVELEDAFMSTDEVLEFIPTIYVNFDDRVFYSFFPEPMSFENYVPVGWIGEYKDFFDEVPEQERYWLVDGDHFFDEIFKKFKKI